MTNITIPPATEEAVARSMCDWDGFDCDELQTAADGTTYVMWQAYILKARAACLALIENWPGMDTRPNIYGRQDAILILPITENSNDKG